MDGMPMLSRLVVNQPSFSLFFLVNLAAFLFVAIALFLKLKSNSSILTRLAFCLAIMVCLAYQLPLVIFSLEVEDSLGGAWRYAFVVNVTAAILTSWIYLTRRLDVPGQVYSYPRDFKRAYLVTGVLGFALIGLYLSAVPWECTALYALLYDPPYTLLARELGVRLLGTSLATYSLGAYAGAVAPIFLMLSIWKVEECFSRRRAICGLFFGLCGFIAVAALLVTGIKGLLMPSALMSAVGVLYYKKTWSSRFLSMAVAVMFFFSAVNVFEFIKERGVYESNGNFDFPACSVKMGTCEGSMSLVESMKGQIAPLGLSRANVDQMQPRLVCMCEGHGENFCSDTSLARRLHSVEVTASKPSLEDITGAKSRSSAETQVSEGRGAVLDSKDGKLSQSIAGISPLILMGLPGRFVTYAKALLYRLFVIPFQVSVWHYMYAETELIDGMKTLPFARRVFGDSLNMPELVYQKYGSVYWGGDKTNTSSAPTSFIFAYTAYLGWPGLALAMACVIVLDLILICLTRMSSNTLLPVWMGLIVIMSAGFVMADFMTVLFSHGGMASIILLLVNAFFARRKS